MPEPAANRDTTRTRPTTASPHRAPTTNEQNRPREAVSPAPRLLKNGHPAHVLTTEDRRKGAATTNSVRRARRAAFEDEKFERAIEKMIALDEARQARRRERYPREKQARPARARATPEPAEQPVPLERRIDELEAQLARTREGVEAVRLRDELGKLFEALRAERGAGSLPR